MGSQARYFIGIIVMGSGLIPSSPIDQLTSESSKATPRARDGPVAPRSATNWTPMAAFPKSRR